MADYAPPHSRGAEVPSAHAPAPGTRLSAPVGTGLSAAAMGNIAAHAIEASIRQAPSDANVGGSKESPRRRVYFGVLESDSRYMLLASKYGDLRRLRKSLTALNPLEARDDHDNTPLHQAAVHGHLEVCKTLLATEPALAKAVNNGRNSALHLAAWAGFDEVCRLLLSAGADVNARGGDGFTPLHFACREDVSSAPDPAAHARVVRILREAGADGALRTASNATANDLARSDAVRAELPGALAARAKASYTTYLNELLAERALPSDADRQKLLDELPTHKLPSRDLCPVTHAPMLDPVATCDGHVYERHAITLWLEAHATSPCVRPRATNPRPCAADARLAQCAVRKQLERQGWTLRLTLTVRGMDSPFVRQAHGSRAREQGAHADGRAARGDPCRCAPSARARRAGVM